MKPLLSTVALLFAFVLFAFASSSAFAAMRTVTLSVPGMYCSTCPITVKEAISRVAGVASVATNLQRREAVITFDDGKTSIEALTRATADVGYPSRVKP